MVLLPAPYWRIALVLELKIYWTVFLDQDPILAKNFYTCLVVAG